LDASGKTNSIFCFRKWLINIPVQPGGEISLNISPKLLNKVRKKLQGEATNMKKKPIAFDVKLSFIMGSEKGVLEVSASSGNTKIGKAKMNYEANSQWKRTGSEDFKAEALNI
jgi:hypothetical protein